MKGGTNSLQVIKCGIASALAGAVFLIVFYCGGDIWRFSESSVSRFIEYMSSISWIVSFVEMAGSSHFSIHVMAVAVFAWSQCVWWKIGAYNPVEKSRLMFFAFTTAAFYVAQVFLITGVIYQSEAIKFLECLTCIIVFVSYVFSMDAFVRSIHCGPADDQDAV